MSTEYQIKGIDLSDFENIGDVKIVKSYEEVTERNKSFYDLDIQDQYEYMLSQMSESDRFLELDRFKLSELTLVKYIQKYYPEMLVVKTRGYRTREEELEMFNEHSSRYDGLYEDMDGNFVTSKEELEFREKTLKEINEFWDEFVTSKEDLEFREKTLKENLIDRFSKCENVLISFNHYYDDEVKNTSVVDFERILNSETNLKRYEKYVDEFELLEKVFVSVDQLRKKTRFEIDYDHDLRIVTEQLTEVGVEIGLIEY